MPYYSKNGFVKVPRKVATHFLSFPLTAPSSRLQFEKSFRRFADDPSTADVPTFALNSIGALHLSIGVMSLSTPGRVEAATRFLSKLDVNSMLDGVDLPRRQDFDQPEKSCLEQASMSRRTFLGSIATSKVPSLEITMSGLASLPPDMVRETIALNATCHDSTSRIQPFADSLFRCFTTAGFLVAGQSPPRLKTRIVDMRRIKTQIPACEWVRKAAGRDAKKPSTLDARALTGKYKEYEWASHIRLEKLSICERGLKIVYKDGRKVDKIFREIASVPLP